MYKIIVIIRFHWITFNYQRPVMPAVVVLYYHCMWTCEQSAVTAVSRPRPRLQHRQVLTAASVCGRRETPGARQSGQPLSWLLPRMRTPRSLHNLGWRGHWPPTGAVYSLCRSVTQFLLITASNGACTCMQPCPGMIEAVTQNCHGVKWYNELDSE